LARFLTPDPKYLAFEALPRADFEIFLKTPQALHLYAYVLNNPATFTDPSGMDNPRATKQKTQKTQDKNRASNEPDPTRLTLTLSEPGPQ